MDGLVLLVGLYTERRGWSALCPPASRCVTYITAYALGAAIDQPSVLWLPDVKRTLSMLYALRREASV